MNPHYKPGPTPAPAPASVQVSLKGGGSPVRLRGGGGDNFRAEMDEVDVDELDMDELDTDELPMDMDYKSTTPIANPNSDRAKLRLRGGAPKEQQKLVRLWCNGFKRTIENDFEEYRNTISLLLGGENIKFSFEVSHRLLVGCINLTKNSDRSHREVR